MNTVHNFMKGGICSPVDYPEFNIQIIEVRKDYRCHECKQWFEETSSFFDEETNEEVELCEECIEIYKQ